MRQINEDAFFADLEESLLDDDSPLWWKETDDAESQEHGGVPESPVLAETLQSARQFIPSYSADLRSDYGSPDIEMYSLEDYIPKIHQRYSAGGTGWDMCLKCTLEGNYKGTRVLPSVVKLATTPLPSSPVNILLIGEA